MAEELPPLIVTVLGDASGALGMLNDLEARLLAFSRQDFTANVGLNGVDKVLTEVATANAALDTLDRVVESEIDGDDSGLEAAIARAQIAIAALAKEAVNIPIDGDPNPFLAVVAELHAMVEEPVDIPIDATGLKGIMAQVLATRGAMAALKTDSILADNAAKNALTESDLLSWDAVNSSIRAAKEASIAASLLSDQAAARIASDAGAAATSGGGAGRGGGGFLGTALGSAAGGAAAKGGLLGFGTKLLPTIPLAGFGTLGAAAGFGAESIAGLAAGLIGFAAHGVLGGLALGLTSAITTGVGALTDNAGIGQAIGDIKQYGSLQQNLAQAKAVYGTGSSEYALAQYQYQQWAQTLSPAYIAAVSKASAAKTQFGALFDKATGPAATTGANIVTQGIGVADTFLPTIGKFAAENMTIIQKALQPLFAWLQGPGLKAFTQIEQVFTSHLPTAMHAFVQGFELLVKTVAKFAPETGGVMKDLDKLFTRLNGPGFGKFTGEVQRAIDAFKVWEKFGKAVIGMIDELFKHDAKTGEAVIESLTKLIGKFNDWANTVAGGDKLHEYMEAHKQEVLQLIGLFGNLISIMGQVHLTVGPDLMEIVGDLLKFVNLLLEIPGVDKILSYVIAFEILGRHMSILKPFMTAFNNGILKLVLAPLHALGDYMSGMGGVFGKLGGWLKGLGNNSPAAQMKATATQLQSISDSMEGIGEVMTAAADAMTEAAGQMSAAAATIQKAFAGIQISADDTAGVVVTASETMDTALESTGATAQVAAAQVEEAAGTEDVAGIAGAAGAGVGSAGLLARLFGKGGGTVAAEDAGAAGAAEEGGGLLASASFLPALIGFAGVQLYNGLLEKKLSKVIGTNAASALGDTGMGAALGTAVLPGVGTAVGAGLGLAYAERTHIASLFTGSNVTGAHPNTALSNARNEFATNTPSTPHPSQSQSLLAKDSTLQKQLAAIQVLTFNANEAKSKDGANSSQYKSALKALQSTEQKYFPSLGKDVSLKGVDTKISTMSGHIQLLKQTADAAKPYIMELDEVKTTLKTQKGQLDTLIKGGASKDAIDGVKTEIQHTTQHLDNIKTVVNDGVNATHQVKTDTKQLWHLMEIKDVMGKVNTDTTKLHTDLTPLTGSGITIAKLPPQAMKASGAIKATWG